MRRHVYYYTHLGQPAAEVAEVFRGPAHAWLPQPATPVDGGWELRLSADGAVPRPIADHLTHVEVGEATDDGDLLMRSLSWRSATAERVIPVFEGDLELVALPGYGCRLSLLGSYRPPLAVIGGAGDRLLGHRIAEACTRRFVLDVAERLGVATLHV